MIAWPSGKRPLVDLRLDLDPLGVGLFQRRHLDLVVEVADVADDRVVLHPPHVVEGDDVLVAGGGDEDVGALDDFVERAHLVALHRRLQGADRVDLGDDHPGALAAQRGGAALADVAVAADDGDLAADHHVGAAVDPVDQRVAAAVEVVELRLGDRVVDVDRREEQVAGLGQLVEPVDAGRRLLGDALDVGGDLGPALRVLLERALQRLQDDLELLRFGRVGVRDRAGLLELDALVDEQGRVAAVVEDHVRALAVGPVERLLGAPPVLLQRLAFPGVDGDAGRGDRRGGVVLGAEDVAAGPAHLGAERDQGLDQDRGLDRHVERAGDPRAFQRLRCAVLLAGLHQTRHLDLGEGDLLAAEIGEADVGDLVVLGGGGGCRG